jgi:cytochrome c peroxidase
MTKSRLMKRSLPLAALALGIAALPHAPSGVAEPPPSGATGDPAAVRDAYKEFAVAHAAAGGDRSVAIALGWSKALSTTRSEATGVARLDLVTGTVAVEVTGLGEEADVWLVDNQPVAGDTVAPEAHDRYVRLGRLQAGGASARLVAGLGGRGFRDFDADLVVVSRAGARPAEGGLLFGSPTLFQRTYHREQRLRAGLSATPDDDVRTQAGAVARLLQFALPTASAHSGNALVDQGRQLFNAETFGGNGRTCATCHPASNNFTIDPTFIASRPASDPLFVAERVPALAALENPLLMRQVGLILENLDGFDRPGVMRSVPHTFALRTSLTPATFDGSSRPPNQRTGWSGDGAPGGGTLRDFAVGAVTQHFPRTLARQNGSDFRLPTDAELDAMEAFQLSLGRQAELNVGAMTFRNPVVQMGKRIFNNGGTAPDTTIAQGQCFQCHSNGGATNNGTTNPNFDTGVESLPAQPADIIDPDHNPPDGGFGQAANSFGFGDSKFNTPPLVEAADTGPFFHNNAVETIEEAVNFYNSDAFTASASGAGPPVGAINLAATEVVAVAAFLRVLNANENVRQSTAEGALATGATIADGRAHLTQSLEELADAVDVLRAGKLHPHAVNHLIQAAALDALALAQTSTSHRNALIAQSKQKKAAAQSDMIQ